MTKYHLVTTGGGGNKTDWEVHKLNCKDVSRMWSKRQCNAVSIVDAESPEALIKHELEEELRDMGYSEHDFRVMPCCKQV